MGLDSYIAKQCKAPNGVGGRVVSAIMSKQNQPMYEETKRFLSLSSADHVLDIGCGNGYVLAGLAKQYSCVCTGIDISKSILKTAEHRNKKLIKEGKISFSCQNAHSMAFLDDTFDKVYTINTVYFWESLKGVMVEIRRVLKPSGFFMNTFYSNETLSRLSHTQFGYHKYTVEQIITASKNAGFEVRVMPILDEAGYCVICT
ncbi:MAG: class I SAM-dependent methyltransferase [Methanomicrobiales archaeon]|jgi:ubiquinone/menaquinone biosynthesis C-methylase UbiE|nr:class I SAM-dependent methyltransferase [Methanomicrobiales archaeon]